MLPYRTVPDLATVGAGAAALTAASPRVYYTGRVQYPTTPMSDADAAFTVNTTAKFWAAGEVRYQSPGAPPDEAASTSFPGHLPRITQRRHAGRAVCFFLLRAHAYLMLAGACNPML